METLVSSVVDGQICHWLAH